MGVVHETVHHGAGQKRVAEERPALRRNEYVELVLKLDDEHLLSRDLRQLLLRRCRWWPLPEHHRLQLAELRQWLDGAVQQFRRLKSLALSPLRVRAHLQQPRDLAGTRPQSVQAHQLQQAIHLHSPRGHQRTSRRASLRDGHQAKPPSISFFSLYTCTGEQHHRCDHFGRPVGDHFGRPVCDHFGRPVRDHIGRPFTR